MSKIDKWRKKLKETTSAGAVVYRILGSKAEILLVKSHRGRSWGVPKGHLEKHETLIECARREVFEEAGVEVKLEQVLPVITTVNKNEIKEVHTWLAQQSCSRTPQPRVSDVEVEQAVWFDVEALPKVHVYQEGLIKHAVSLVQTKVSASL